MVCTRKKKDKRVRLSIIDPTIELGVQWLKMVRAQGIRTIEA
jgi:hypothetical protein